MKTGNENRNENTNQTHLSFSQLIIFLIMHYFSPTNIFQLSNNNKIFNFSRDLWDLC